MSLEILIQPQLFSWEPSVTPFSSPYTLAWASCGYLLGIGLLSWTIRKPLPVPKFLAPAHNLGLCLLSLVMVVGTVKEVLQVRLSTFCCQLQCEKPVFGWQLFHTEASKASLKVCGKA